MDLREQQRRAFEENPGLEAFQKRKRALLWGMFFLMMLLKAFNLFAVSGTALLPLVVGLALGALVPGIVALALYRGPWKLAFLLYALAAVSLADILKNALPVLSLGVPLAPLFYVVLAIESVSCAYTLLLAVYLTVPAKSRFEGEIPGAGGEIKRIEIASVMARKTRLTIFDEPEAGIDLWSFQNLIGVFQKLRRETSGSLVVISHQERILEIADELVVLASGVVTAHGPREEILPGLLKGDGSRCAFCPQEGGICHE